MSTAVATPATTAAPGPPPSRKKRRRVTSYFLPVFTAGMIFYLASPVFLMILYSFNNIPGDRQTSKFWGFTLDWWKRIFDLTDLNQSLRASLLIAFPAAIIATILGTFVGLVLGRYFFRGRGLTNFIIFLAIAVPEIVLGSSLLSMFVKINQAQFLGISIPLGKTTILLSHIGFSIAFVAVTVRARVQGMDRSLENAAQDLFATPMVAFFKVTLPLILPGIIAGFMLAFVLSLDDFVITNFVSGQYSTFPIWVYGATRIGLPVQVNVWGTVLFSAGILAALANLVVGAQRRRANAA
jgi:spermidine/putrescine transport system permease protein